MSRLSIKQLRKDLQAPRLAHDTHYGRWVMRPLSIYLTRVFIGMNVAPSAVTLLSLLAGIWGARLLFAGDWMTGILFVNLWYLLDHVDGELARHYKRSSPAGLYFDTILNAIVPPLTFFALGWSLAELDRQRIWFLAGTAAAYGSLMLLIIPAFEDMVIRQWSDTVHPAAKKTSARTGRRKAAGRIFGLLHTAVTFPVFLPVSSLVILTGGDLRALLLLYVALVQIVWIAILSRNVITARADKSFGAG